MAAATLEGYRVQGIDFFGDRDALDFGRVLTVGSYEQLPEIIDQLKFAFAQWLYTGGIENHVHQLKMLPADRLAGCSFDCVNRCRDPLTVSFVLRQAGFKFPETIMPSQATSVGNLQVTGKSWLEKPIRSAGGHSVNRWRDTASVFPGCYLQELVPGASMSAVYFAGVHGLQTIGITRQLIGHSDFVSHRFTYVGSIGPIHLSTVVDKQVRQLGQTIFDVFQPSGFFGVDFMLTGNDLWPIEINPRITASVEIFRRAMDLSIIESQLTHQLIGRNAHAPHVQSSQRVFGKAIVFNRGKSPIQITASFSDWAYEKSLNQSPAELGDVPNTGTIISRNAPILTLYVCEENEQRAVKSLEDFQRQIRLELKQRCSADS